MSAWRETALSEVLAEATPGFAFGEDVEDGVFQFRMNNITTDGQLDLSKRRRVPRDYRNIDRFFVKPGDVLFNATNSPDLVGKTAFFPGLDEPVVFSNHFLRLRPRDTEMDGRYLTRWLNLQFLHGRFKGMCRQWVNQATVGRDALLSLRVPCPPLPEQRRIAEILDKADALRAKRREALAKLDTLTQSIFLDTFGDPATNPKGWPVHKIEEVAEIVSGATPRTDNGSYWDGDVNWVTPKELSGLEGMYIGATERRITRQGLESCAASILPPGSVLFSSRAPIGHTAVCTAPMATNQGFKSFVPRAKVLEPHFLLFWLRLRRSFLEGLGTGATFKEVSKAVVARIDLCVPPFDLQLQFAQRVVAVERIRSVQSIEREQLDDLFTSLQHRAFRGEL
jgi:type I restriction enzyme S subunit